MPGGRPETDLRRDDRVKLALHWKILIGLALGVVVGVGINLLWTSNTWAAMGVNDARYFLTGSLTPPERDELEGVLPLLSDPAPDGVLGFGSKAFETMGIAGDAEIVARSARWLLRDVPPPPDHVRFEFPSEEHVAALVTWWNAEVERIVAELAKTGEDKVAIADLAIELPSTAPEGDVGIDEMGYRSYTRQWLFSELPEHAQIHSADPSDEATFVADVARFVRNANAFIGDLFMRLLGFIAVPIVLFSLIAGVASLNDTAKLGRIGGKTIGIYLATTAVAITVGLLAANVVGPGRGFPEELRESLRESSAADASTRIGNAQDRPTTWDVLLDVVPQNPFTALATTEMLQVVFAALMVGIGLTMLPKAQAAPVVRISETMTEVVIKVVHLILIIAPYAVFSLIVEVLADLGLPVLGSLAKYCLTVVGGLAFMMFVVYPLVLRVLTPVRYRRFFGAISPAQLLAFSSASSGATLPVTMECCEERLGVREEVNSFVLPIGATINMDGTALYQGVAAVFIAQMYGMDLTIGEQLTIVLTATPSSGMPTLWSTITSITMP
ncbi:MAG: dicarboxylate/amino acid:cation symporter, partial [Planctomycetota bacterium]